MKSKTESGLFFIILGSVTSIFSTLGSAVVPSDSPGTCLTGLLSFLTLIFILYGLIMMYVGRNEFGEEHRQFVTYAIIAIIIGIALFVMGAFLMIAGIFSGISMDPGSREPTIDHSQVAQAMTNGLIVIQFGGLAILLGEIFLVFKLENEQGRNILYLTLVVGIITAIVTTILISSALSELMNTMENTPTEDQEEELSKFQNTTNFFSLIGVINTILLLIAYYIPYDRIQKGELVPQVPLPPGYGVPMYPPPYPYQPYPPQHPYQPPQPQIDPNIVEVETMTPDSPSEVKEKPIETITCPHCGTQYPKENEVCPACGK